MIVVISGWPRQEPDKRKDGGSNIVWSHCPRRMDKGSNSPGKE